MSEICISVYDNKYTFISRDGDYRIHVLRHGEDWLVIEYGCNAVLALMIEFNEQSGSLTTAKAKIEWLQARVKELEDAIGYAGDAIRAWIHAQETQHPGLVDMQDLPLVENELRAALVPQPKKEKP